MSDRLNLQGIPLARPIEMLLAGGFMVSSSNCSALPSGLELAVTAVALSHLPTHVTFSLVDASGGTMIISDAIIARMGLRMVLIYGTWQPVRGVDDFQTGLVLIAEPATTAAQIALGQAL